jgi:hypothetical protein
MDGHDRSQAAKVGDARRCRGLANEHSRVLAGTCERFIDARAGCHVLFGAEWDDR